MRTVILHYHLFKNAGSSLDASFKAWLGEHQWATKEFPGHLNQNRNQVRQWIIDNPDVVCFSSHSAHLPPPQIDGVKIIPVIFIRHPLDRILSAYEFEKKQGADTLGSVIARNTSLSGYIDIFLSQDNWNQLSNFHCHRLSRYFELPDKSLVERALMAVNALPFIGVVENYAASVAILEAYLKENGLPNASLKTKSVNRNAGRALTLSMRLENIRNTVGVDVYEKLLEKNKGDFQVYEKVTGKPVELAGKKKHLIQYWDGLASPQIESLMNEWKDMNGDYHYILFNEKSAFEFIEKNYGPMKAKAFANINFQAMKSDVFRLAAVNVLGGLYIDAATKCNQPISTWNIDSGIPTFIKKRNGRIANALISASSADPLIKQMLEQAWAAILKQDDGNIWLQTGPGMLKKIIDTARLPYQLIKQENEDKYFRFLHDFDHKKSAHWSKQQLFRPLYGSRHPKQLFQKIASYQDVFNGIELDLHIGQHKTGTTSIQQALVEMNESELLYPKTGLINAGHHLWSDVLGSGNPDRIVMLIEALADEIRDKKVSRLILSSEYFSSKNEIQFDKKRMDNIWTWFSAFSMCFKKSNVIFYVRDQVDSIESRIKQAIESRICLQDINWKAIANNPCLSYASFFEAILHYFPHSTIEPRSFERAIKNGGVVEDFSSRLGIDLTARKSNVSHSDIELFSQMLLINKLDTSVDIKMDKKRFLIDESKKYKSASSKVSITNIFKKAAINTICKSTASLLSDNDKEEIKKSFVSENQLFESKMHN